MQLIQARRRQLVAPGPWLPGRAESDYERCGALQYLCAWDVRRGIPWGRCEPKTGIDAFTRLVDQVMATPTVVLVPDGTSPEEAARFAQTMRPVMVASLIFQAVLFGAVAALIVIGSIRRWRWMFWAVLVLLGLNVVGLLIPLLLGVAGLMRATPPPGVIPSRPPPVPMVVGVAGTLAQAAAAVLFVAMVVAGVRIGPWACRRAAEVAPAAGPPADA